MHNLFPDIRPYADHQLQVDDLHTIYVEECGKPDGLPVLVVHGGPGVGTAKQARCFFDPDIYRIILFDQRGCGKSKPHGETESNSTDLLIKDMDAIRQHLDVDKWLLFGGSWGSTLTMLYAQTYPQTVLGFILRGVFLGRPKDMDWLYKEGANRVFPEHWHKFEDDFCGHEESIIDSYYKVLRSHNELARMSAAKSWAAWEAKCATLRSSPKTVDSFTEPKTALGFAMISTHYMKNHCFIEANQILDNIEKINHLPCIIVHGRYDMVCPLDQAYSLFQRWPASELDIVREAGHSQFEPGISDALLKAAVSMAKRLGKPEQQA